MLHLLIARHGNTFEPGDRVLRVGRGTDIPLSNSGKEQAKNLGEYLFHHHRDIQAVYTSTLKRTLLTAGIILSTMHLEVHITPAAIFDEIDYGPDEGKPESDVIARIGTEAIKNWEDNNVVPTGWNVDPEKITENWREFANDKEKKFPDQLILVVTSNGIARFAPEHNIKLKTGAVSYLTVENGHWTCIYSNRRPDAIF